MKKALYTAIAMVCMILSSCTQEPIHEHDFDCGILVERVEPTCTVDGYEIRMCRGCDAERIERLPSSGEHTKDSGTISVADGHELTTYRCTMCSVVLETVKEHRHSEAWSSNSSSHWKEMLCGCTTSYQKGVHNWNLMEETVETDMGGVPVKVRIERRVCRICAYETASTVTIVE